MQVRLLWQQRTFTAALAEIMKQLGPEWQQQVSQKAALLLALAHLLHAVPQALYRDKLALLLPLLVASLTALAEGTVASADAVVALLRVLAYSVVDSKGDAASAAHDPIENWSHILFGPMNLNVYSFTSSAEDGTHMLVNPPLLCSSYIPDSLCHAQHCL